MKRDRIETSIGNYLTAVLLLSETDGEEQLVGTSILAKRLGVAPASVTQMIQKLAAKPYSLLLYKRSGGVRLSAGGKRVALQQLRRHQLLCCYLFQELGLDRNDLHHEASLLAHHISLKFEERLATKLGSPMVDPFGKNIPKPRSKF